ncbi:MAG TPA: PE-PPE domain-containing protein [Mycobacterium sp.]|nr:PE-PPE domain-containing protein [Mycobacterium sp.]
MASAGAGVLALTSIMNSAFAFGETPDVAAASDPTTIGLVMGGSGTPIPGADYVTAANDLYITNPFTTPFLPFTDTTYPGVLADGLFTPEGYYPLSGIKTLPVVTSVSQGVTILNNNIQANITARDPSTVFGYSQSAVISSLEMQQLDPSGTPSDLPVQFVLIGDQMNPNGGIFARFPGLQLPSLGYDFYGATPADSFASVIYTQEYDGYADFCQYPINLLCDLNAFLGIEEVHGTYLSLTPAQIATAIPLMTEGPTETTYYMIPTENLPLLDPVRDIPLIGNPLADLLQPDLTILVNLGYGSITEGWSQGPANVPTPFGLFPHIPLGDILQALVGGTQQGVEGAMAALTDPSASSLSVPSLADLADPLAALTAAASDPSLSLTDLVNTLSSDASTAYAVLLPTADIINALLTSVPAYDVSLFLDNLSNPIDAIGLPIAADTAIATLAAGFEFEVIADAASTIIGSLTSLIP